MPPFMPHSDHLSHLPRRLRGRDFFPQSPMPPSYPLFTGFGPPAISPSSKSGGMSHPPRLLPQHLGEQFSTTHALEEGVSKRRLRSKDLESPFHRVRRVKTIEPLEKADADTTPYAERRKIRREVMGKMRAYATVMPKGSFFCGRSAAIAYDVWIDHPDDLDVAVFSPQRAPRAKGVKGRKVAPHLATIRHHEQLTVSSPASTWAMLARDVSLRELVAIGDAIVLEPRDKYGTKHPDQALATIAELHAAANAGPRPPATANLLAALDFVRVGSGSPLETDFRLDAAAAGLPTPELDVEIRGPSGRLLGVSEFVFRKYLVVVEVEGDHHRTNRKQWNRDIEKYHAYAEAGLEVVRLTSTHIRGWQPSAVGIVAAVLRRHGWDG